MADNISIIKLNEVDSTNRYARDEASTLWREAGTGKIIAITAKHQTAGRGQLGNIWQSQAGNNLLLTLLVRPGQSLKVTEQFKLSQTVAVALHSTMKRYGIDTRLKWPNDIYVGNRKLAGILIELDYSGNFVEQAIIGVGLNVNQVEFPTMDRTPVSMKMLKNNDFDIEDILCNVLKDFEMYYNNLSDEHHTIASEYSSLLLGHCKENRFADADGAFTAIIEGVDSYGRIILRTDDGSIRKYAFKEVEMLL
ncbi:MAG: biotin--[Bacteroidaceae bacterium]|nr:biotin--[acetyl-CoA-carboxylase] ligase [Bacteroidaceae bacterium]